MPTGKFPKKLSAVVVLAGTLAGGFAYYQSRRKLKLSEKDVVVLADFSNSTGDPVFDDTLNQALAVELGQSPYLEILPNRLVRHTLALMGHKPGDRITREMAREICIRTGNKAMLAGSIASIGSHYVVALEASSCASGDTIAKEFSEVANKESTLSALHKIAASMRRKLGESLASVQKFDAPVEGTTSSLDALKTYTSAINTNQTKGEAEAIPIVQRAIEQDPNFAEAYMLLGTAYGNLGQTSLADKALKKAFELSGQVSEPERYRIASFYYAIDLGDLERALQNDTAWAETYPRSLNALNNSAVIYNILGQYEKALRIMQQTLQRNPDDVVSYANLAGVYLALGRTDDAKALFDQATAHKLDGGFLRQMLYYYAFLKGDDVGMQRQVEWARNRPGDEDLMLSLQSDTEAYFGRLEKARELSRGASDSALRADSKDTAALWQASAALREAEFGNSAVARQGAAAALALVPARDVKVLAAMALASAGDTAKAGTIVSQLENDFPSNTVLKVFWLPSIKATIALKQGNASEAIADLEVAVPYELGEPFPYELGTMYPAYVRGQAYLAAHNAAAAVAEFQKILNHPGLTLNSHTGVLAYLQMARAKELMGDDDGARKSYQAFFSRWKVATIVTMRTQLSESVVRLPATGADPDIPILKQAKAEYAKLQ